MPIAPRPNSSKVPFSISPVRSGQIGLHRPLQLRAPGAAETGIRDSLARRLRPVRCAACRTTARPLVLQCFSGFVGLHRYVRIGLSANQTTPGSVLRPAPAPRTRRAPRPRRHWGQARSGPPPRAVTACDGGAACGLAFSRPVAQR